MRASPLVVALSFALLLPAAGALSSPAPAAAREQCLPQEQCAALRDQFREHRREVRAIKQQIRRLRHQIRGLPQDAPERHRLRRRVRELRHELRQLRHDEMRPLRRRLREGCRGCGELGPPS